ncbi:MAG: hypothetical protein ACO226_04220 [Hylemonella sp.]
MNKTAATVAVDAPYQKIHQKQFKVLGDTTMVNKVALIFGKDASTLAISAMKMADLGFNVAYTYEGDTPPVPARMFGVTLKGYWVKNYQSIKAEQIVDQVQRDFGAYPQCVIDRPLASLAV